MLLFENSKFIAETFPVGSYACNCTVIYSKIDKSAIVVDPGNDLVGIKKIINDRNLSVKKLVHTHAHFDHIGKSSELADDTKATLHLHEGDLFLYQALKQQGLFFGENVGAPKNIDSFIQDQEEFKIDDSLIFKACHTPGHTPGSCSFYTELFESPLLLAGDTLFRQSVGRTDLPGGDFDTIASSIKTRLYTLPGETLVVTGHGPSTQIAHEKKNNPFVRA